MNLSSTAPSTASRDTPTTDTPSCRRDDAPRHDARETFERALMARQRSPRDESEETTSDAAAMAAAWAPAGSTPAPVRALVVPAGASAGSIDAATGGPRAAIQTALNADSGVPATLPGGADPASVWEASVRGPDHLALDLRAERISTPGASPSWGLTIGSPALGAELMVRHATRLNERLRKHGVELDHVRIESPDDEPRR